MSSQVLVLAEHTPQRSFLEAIFQRFSAAGHVRFSSFYDRDGAVGIAGSYLLSHPDQFVAVVLETNSEKMKTIREIYHTARRRITRVCPSDEYWHVALAIPNLRAWALIDDNVREHYDKIRQDAGTAKTKKERRDIERANYFALSSRIAEFTASHPFDLEALKQKSRQVRELCDFIEDKVQPQAVVATAADWF